MIKTSTTTGNMTQRLQNRVRGKTGSHANNAVISKRMYRSASEEKYIQTLIFLLKISQLKYEGIGHLSLYLDYQCLPDVSEGLLSESTRKTAFCGERRQPSEERTGQ